MIDFSKLKVLTAAERQRDDEQRIARQIEEDLKRRREWSRKSVTVTLSLEAEFRHTLSGGQCLHLRGAQADGKTVAATWYAPEHFTRRQVDAIFDQLTQGVRLTLDGYWSAATFNDKKRFTFVAQFIRVRRRSAACHDAPAQNRTSSPSICAAQYAPPTPTLSRYWTFNATPPTKDGWRAMGPMRTS